MGTQFLTWSDPLQKLCVFRSANADEYSCILSSESFRIDARALQRLPARFQQKPLLWIHSDGLPWRNAEEFGIKISRRIQHSSRAAICFPGSLRVGIENRIQCHPLTWNLADRMPFMFQQIPVVVRRIHATRETTSYSHNRNRLTSRGFQFFNALPKRSHCQQRRFFDR